MDTVDENDAFGVSALRDVIMKDFDSFPGYVDNQLDRASSLAEEMEVAPGKPFLYEMANLPEELKEKGIEALAPEMEEGAHKYGLRFENTCGGNWVAFTHLS